MCRSTAPQANRASLAKRPYRPQCRSAELRTHPLNVPRRAFGAPKRSPAVSRRFESSPHRIRPIGGFPSCRPSYSPQGSVHPDFRHPTTRKRGQCQSSQSPRNCRRPQGEHRSASPAPSANALQQPRRESSRSVGTCSSGNHRPESARHRSPPGRLGTNHSAVRHIPGLNPVSILPLTPSHEIVSVHQCQRHPREKQKGRQGILPPSVVIPPRGHPIAQAERQ